LNNLDSELLLNNNYSDNSKNKNKMKSRLVFSAIFFITIMLSADAISVASSNIVPKIGTIIVDADEVDVYVSINFTITLASNSGPVDYYVLNAHDGTPPQISTENVISHAFPYEGEFLVSITAVTKCQLTDTKTILVKVNNTRPFAEIQAPDTVYEYEKVSIKAINIIDSNIDLESLIFQWVVDTGNGITIFNTSEFSIIWNNSGIMPVTLTIWDDQYALYTDTVFINVKNIQPNANFTITPENAIVVEDEVFVVNASNSWDTPNDLETLNYYWDFGDGTFERGLAVSHSYSESGNYSITLYVFDDDGNSSSITKTVSVLNVPPNISLTEDKITLYEGQSYTFQAESWDTPTDYARLVYNWSFGAEGWNATYTALDDGEKVINVSVQDPEGLMDSDSVIINVLNVPPSVSFYSAYVETDLYLKVWGTPNNSFTIKVIEIGDEFNNTIGIASVFVEDWCEPVISDPIPLILDLSKKYQIEVNYTEGTEPWGINFAELIFNFTDGSQFIMFHIFDACKCWCCCPWFVNTDEWLIDPSDHLFNMPISFNGSVYDPGYDEISINVTLRIHLLFSLSSVFWWIFWLLFYSPYYQYYEIDNTTALELNAWFDDSNNLFYFSIDIYQKVLNLVNVSKEPYECETPFTALARPIDLSFLEIFNCPLFNNPWFNLTVVEAVNILEASVSDDDGGTDFTSINITTKDGKLHVVDMAPSIDLPVYSGTEDNLIPFYAFTYDYYNDSSGNLTYSWHFGDNTTYTDEFIVKKFENEGKYLVELSVQDGLYERKTGYYINILDFIPIIEFSAPDNASEDTPINLKAWTTDTDSDAESLRIWWEFNDGTIGNGNELQHRWAISGNYTIISHVIDDNGKETTYSKTIEIYNVPPRIEGPNGFQAVEGTTFYLDIKVSDSPHDEIYLQYNWEFDGINLKGRKPSLWLDDGNYTCKLNISDMDSTSLLNVSVMIINQQPIVITSNLVYYGIINEITLKAYAFDSFVDIEDLNFEWSIDNTPISDGTGTFSSVSWTPDSTNVYEGVVIVHDDSPTSFTKHFQVSVTFDADGDGITDEQEEILGLSPDDTDTDDDWITDWYELNIFGTDPLSWDTDNDGLADGAKEIENVSGAMIMVGELYLGTDPLNNDTDNDKLADGLEVIGWISNITHNNNEIELLYKRLNFILKFFKINDKKD